MDTQYKKNLKAVLTASKNYTDKVRDSLRWEFGTYDLSVETVNGTTMLLPTPANTIQATMDKIYGASEVVVDSQTNESGIHNLELSGLKVERQNKIDISLINSSYYSIKGNTITTITTDVRTWENVEKIGFLKAGTYYLNFTSLNGGNIEFKFYNEIDGYYPSSSYKTATNGYSFTITRDSYIMIKIPTANTICIGLMISTTNSNTYQPYIAPTTLPIDLSTILYNGSPLFEGNSLKAVGTAKDYITPYLAHKEIGSRAYQSGDEEDTSVLTDGTTTLYPLATPIEVDINLSQLVKFEAYSNGSITLVNTNNQDTTSTFKYLKEVAK